jgi:hypothetical protein
MTHDLDELHHMYGIEEVHADEPTAVAHRFGDPRDR